MLRKIWEKRGRSGWVIGALPMALFASTLSLWPGADAASPAEGVQFDGVREYIVLYKRGVELGPRLRSEVARDNEVERRFTSSINGALLRLEANDVNRLRSDDRVLAIDRNGPVSIAASSQSSRTAATWGLDRIDERTRPLDGLITTPNSGAGVEAYIIDSGIRLDHSEFTGRVNSKGFTSISDGRGVGDCDGHGTHVSGTVAGSTYGVAPAARLTAIRVLNCDGEGSWDGLIAGIDWMILDHGPAQPAIANLSLGGSYRETVNVAVQRAINDGISMVVAAGNDASDACLDSPGSSRNAVTVGSSTSMDKRSWFSNHGGCLDLFAPGSNILSAGISSPTATDTFNGTSMAAPHVAGAGALRLSRNPSLSPSQLTSEILSDATPNLVTDIRSGSPNLLLYSGTDTPDTGNYGTADILELSSLKVSFGYKIRASVTTNRNICDEDGRCTWNTEGYVFPQSQQCKASSSGGAYGFFGSSQSSIGTQTVSNEFFTTAASPFRVCVYVYSNSTGVKNLVYDEIIAPDASNPTDPTPPPPSCTTPANDNFSNRQVLSSLSVVTGNNCGASAEEGEGPHYSSYGPFKSIWYRWTAPSSGLLSLSAKGSEFIHSLGVYTGTSVGNLTRVGSHNGIPPNGASVSVSVTGGEIYSIAIDGFQASESGVTKLSGTFRAGPANDDFESGIELASLGEVRGTNLNATVQEGEPPHDWFNLGPEGSIWYRWTAPNDGVISLHTEGSSFFPDVAIYTGATLATITRRATANDPQSFEPLVLRVSEGTTYHIALDREGYYWENLSTTYLTGTFSPAPANDNFRNARQINRLSDPTVGTTVSASRENGEPAHGGSEALTSIWYKWRATQKGRVELDSGESDVSTVLAVYQGESIETLTDVAAEGSRWATFDVNEGREYYIALDGVPRWPAPEEGRVQIDGRFLPSPANDDFEDSITLANLSTRTVNTVAASAEPGEPSHAAGIPARRSVWYSWTAPSKSFVELETERANFCPALAVYTGDTLGSLTSIAQDYNSNASVSFRAQAGVTYRIAVAGCHSEADEGSLTLFGSWTPVAGNDDFVDAISLAPPEVVSGTTFKATAEYQEPSHRGGSGTAYESIWYRWRATGPGLLKLDPTQSQTQADVSVYRGSALPNLFRLASGQNRAIEVRVENGVEYWVAIDTGPSECWGCGPGGPVRLSVGFERDPEGPADPPADPPTASPLPRPAFLSGPRKRSSARKARFTFSGVQGARHECWSTARPYWNGCRSPLVLKGLWPARHTMKVRQAKGGQISAVSTYRWTIVKKRRR